MRGTDETRWERLYLTAAQLRVSCTDKPPMRPWETYLAEMRGYLAQGSVYDACPGAVAGAGLEGAGMRPALTRLDWGMTRLRAFAIAADGSVLDESAG